MFGEIRNAQGERLDHSFHPGRPSERNIVVLGHGVTGNKDRPLLVAIAESLERSGIAALRISYSGNGASEGRFEDSTISKEVDDLGAVFDALKGWNIIYTGHSQGAAVGVLCASRDTRIKRLVSLAGMVHTAAFAAREFGNLRPGADVMWDKPECPLSQTYLDDMKQIDSVAGRARSIHIPWLLLHGTADDVVPIDDSRDIFQKANQPKTLVELEGADHSFGGDFLPLAAERVAQWVKEQLETAGQ